jgi:hypothetical protein
MNKPQVRVSTREARALLRGGKPSGRQGKYNAKGEHVDGHWFASQAEAARYRQLLTLMEHELIDKVELQPSYPLVVNAKHIATYRADFRYSVLDETGRRIKVVIEDVKGMVTDVYVMKKKLVEALYSIEINEIPAKQIGQWEGRTP